MFYGEYCDLKEKYNKIPTDLKLLAEYADMLSKLSDMDEKFAVWEDESMNDIELKYCLKVKNRIT
ncbi:hypothetical protein AC622_18685 [Bacillus sp. FJAT-27916]|uniref:DUF6591 domain-containing protein n=1 Tax=Bacillus sp. FJAT-27916 TaxID=1679169 RepID=UPI000670A49D|nr:hypothetical protein AC622_18685 [Bacillus sp. FJAT-27916]